MKQQITRAQPLARYVDERGRPREVLASAGAAGSVLVLDRDAITDGDWRLVAHLGADEPRENAALVCRSYLAGVRERQIRCRALDSRDVLLEPFHDDADEHRLAPVQREVVQGDARFCLLELPTGMSIPELRWWRRSADDPAGRVVSLRETIAEMQSYEPCRTLTSAAVRRHRMSPHASVSVLGAELARVLNSPIVLNRALREAVLAAVSRRRLTMSEIAIRCGRRKRDGKGCVSGETSWLARRIGMLPEAGRVEPTPWVHTDVLALIAREGLGVSPREVEVH